MLAFTLCLNTRRTFSGEDFRIGGSDPGCADRLFKAYGPPLVANQTTGATAFVLDRELLPALRL
jgi:hypothetical protein